VNSGNSLILPHTYSDKDGELRYGVLTMWMIV